MLNLEIDTTSVLKGSLELPASLCSRWEGHFVNLCQYRVIAGFVFLTSTSTSFSIGFAIILLLDAPLTYCLEKVFDNETRDNSKRHKFCRIVIGLAVVGTSIYGVNTWTLKKLSLPLGYTSLIVITAMTVIIPTCLLVEALISEPD